MKIKQIYFLKNKTNYDTGILHWIVSALNISHKFNRVNNVEDEKLLLLKII